MKAIILAAGQSSRLYPLTRNRPKSLLDMGQTTLIGYQIRTLKREGVEDIILVTGFLAHQFEYLRNEGVRLIHNPKYSETNNLYSLWYARDELLSSDSLCLHADLVFHPDILRKCLETPMDLGLVVDRQPNRETMRVKIEATKVIQVGKEVPYEKASGTFIGMAKLSPVGASIFVSEMENMVRKGNREAYFTITFQSLMDKGISVTYCYTGGYPWIEVDTFEDLDRLRSEVFPKIQLYSFIGKNTF